MHIDFNFCGVGFMPWVDLLLLHSVPFLGFPGFTSPSPSIDIRFYFIGYLLIGLQNFRNFKRSRFLYILFSIFICYHSYWYSPIIFIMLIITSFNICSRLHPHLRTLFDLHGLVYSFLVFLLWLYYDYISLEKKKKKSTFSELDPYFR